MKITKNLLKEMIEEEMKVIKLGLGDQPMMSHGYAGGEQQELSHGEPVKDPDGYEGRMAKSNLYNAAQDCMAMHELIQDDENLEPWLEEKIAVASSMLTSVARYLKYEKMKG
jgi:hypothetical protein